MTHNLPVLETTAFPQPSDTEILYLRSVTVSGDPGLQAFSCTGFRILLQAQQEEAAGVWKNTIPDRRGESSGRTVLLIPPAASTQIINHQSPIINAGSGVCR
jgi:hypothetical protein